MDRPLFFVPVIFGFVVYAFYLIRFDGGLRVSDNLSSISTPDTENLLQNPRKTPVILAATPFFSGKLFETILPVDENCPWKCDYIDDKRFYATADVAIFHARNFGDSEYATHFSSSNLTNPERLNVFFSLESSPNENVSGQHYPKNFFNVSMTFRRDGTIWLPYDKFENIDDRTRIDEIWTKKEVENAVRSKSKLALQLVSNCETDSRREIYLSKLLEHVNVTVLGACNNSTCDKDSCYKNEIAEHFFYLAFENSVCQDYVTEKFWRIKSLIVPIVLKRSILTGIVNDKYFLAVDDFSSPKELAEKMEFLAANPAEYKKFFEWTKQYKKAPMKPDGLCQICKMAHFRERHQIDDIGKWWNQDANCHPRFAAKF